MRYAHLPEKVGVGFADHSMGRGLGRCLAFGPPVKSGGLSHAEGGTPVLAGLRETHTLGL